LIQRHNPGGTRPAVVTTPSEGYVPNGSQDRAWLALLELRGRAAGAGPDADPFFCASDWALAVEVIIA
jgi:hypothetical protein